MGDFEEHFIQGQEIEVGNDDDGFQGSWYAAKVVQTPLSPNTKLLVQYMTLMDDVESSKPLEEYVDTFIVRPRPPQEEERFFEQGELVEAYHNDGWWEGTITQVHDNLKYSVRLRAMVEEIEFQQSEIRRHHQWIGGRWVGDQELQTIDSSFCVGASVEVCLDDENYRDAWFPAVILNRIDNSSFLVEYQTSRFQNMVGKINETVDLLHIRPFPPNTSQDKTFDLLEKVDAFYDCGWWSGVINRVLTGSRYIVLFKHQHEQREFSHSELRFHIDWIDGKWIQNSKEISSQGRIEAPGQVKYGEAGKTDQNIEMASRCGEDAAIEKSSGQVQSGDAGKTDQNIDMGSRCGENAAKNFAVENSPRQVQFGDAGKTDPNIDMASQCGEDAAKNVAVEKSPGQVKSGDARKTDHNIDMASRSGEEAAKNVAVEKSPGQVKSGDARKTDHNIDMASRSGEEAAKNVAVEKSLGQVQYGEAGMTFQSIDMASQCGEDAAKNVGIEKSPEQAHQHAGNQSNPSKLASPGHGQSYQVESNDQIIDMAVTPRGNSAKTVVAKKSPSFRNPRKVDYQSTPNKVNSASFTINSCKTPTKMQSTSEGDTDSLITREKRKKMQSTPENVTKSIITREKRKKMQSTPEHDTNFIITREKRKKMQSTPEAVKTPLAPIACGRAMATRVLTETDGKLDFATQTTKGQGANVEGKISLESIEVKRVETPILAEMFLNCSEEGYKDHPKDLNSGQEQLKHVLESNGSRNQFSVEDSPHLPQNIIDVEQYEVVNLPRSQVPARPLKLRIRPTRQKEEPLALDDIKQETSKGGSKQTSNVSDRKTKAMVPITKALVKDVEHSGTVGRLQAPVLTSTDVQSKGGDRNAEGESSQAIEAQTKGLEQTTPSIEIINSVVQREDATQETDMDWASSDIGDLHQPPIHYLKDSPIRGSELQNSLDVDVSSFSFGGTIANTLLDQAIRDEVVGERIQQPFLICSSADQMVQEEESFPFIKCSPVWETVESLEVFRVMPQRLHFRPVEQLYMELREGHALGSMVNFANIVEKVGKAKLDDPPSILQEWSYALENLEAYGFNVQPIQARLETLRRIKDEQAKVNEEFMEAEGQISMILAEKIRIEAELDEHNKKIREVEECLNQLIKKQELTVLKKEARDSSIAELKKTLDNARECRRSGTSEFRTLVATPW